MTKEFWAMLEISANSGPVKYEFDEQFGKLVVDRFIGAAMHYPYHYGFIPKTIGGDSDPIDILLYTVYPIMPGTMIKVRPIGMLETEDEKGQDQKILSVPAASVDHGAKDILSYKQILDLDIKKIEHFFQHYKALEKNKWVKIHGWHDSEVALRAILEGMKNYENSNHDRV